MIDNKITIKDDEMVNVQRGAIGHRATWTALHTQRPGKQAWKRLLRKSSARQSLRRD